MSGYSTAMLPGSAPRVIFTLSARASSPNPTSLAASCRRYTSTPLVRSRVSITRVSAALSWASSALTASTNREGSNTNDSSSRCASACAMDDTASKPASVAEDTKNFKGCDTTSSSTIKNSGRHCARFAPACRYRLTSTSQKATHPAPTGTRLPTGSLKFFQRPFRPVAHAEQAQAAPNSVAIQA
jgi:hypothetical protein